MAVKNVCHFYITYRLFCRRTGLSLDFRLGNVLRRHLSFGVGPVLAGPNTKDEKQEIANSTYGRRASAKILVFLQGTALREALAWKIRRHKSARFLQE